MDELPFDAAATLRDLFDGRCAYCGEPATTFDHVTAVAVGGTTSPGNVLPACVSCNSSKRHKDVWAWIEERTRRGLPVSTEVLEYITVITESHAP